MIFHARLPAHLEGRYRGQRQKLVRGPFHRPERNQCREPWRWSQGGFVSWRWEP